MNAFSETIEAIGKMAKACGEVLSAFCKEFKEALELPLAVYAQENSRVKHLALHSKKKRVRKKNIKRLLKGDAKQ